IAPEASVIDLSHHIPPQDVAAARFVLWHSYRYFPEGSIFVCVVDPGVGSDRAIMAVQTRQHTYLAPDNGLLDYVLAETTPRQILRIENPKVMLPTISRTFHGRDIFAPAAAHLAAGFPFTQLGPLHRYQVPPSPFVQARPQAALTARVLHADHFGNLITNCLLPPDWQGRVRVGGRSLLMLRTYGEVEVGHALALRGSHGLLELSIREGNAAQVFRLGPGDPIEVLGS
ncbi:MAG: hypothetical protein D6722_24430, partial [Bacteroidetes bacterium]